MHETTSLNRTKGFDVAQIFPKWTNKIPLMVGAATPVALCGIVFFIWYYFSPRFTDVGYQPKQPIPFSHKLHAGQMGLDCRYCHSTIESAAYAAIPPNATCMNCHINLDLGPERQQRVKPLIDSYEGKATLEWVKVHMLPDYAYFDHSVHLNAGVGCTSCHGRVDQMDVVWQVQPLSMLWCLDCHRNPEPNLRPLDQITNMAWSDADADAYDPAKDAGRRRHFDPKFIDNHADPIPADVVNPPVSNCSGCHR